MPKLAIGDTSYVIRLLASVADDDPLRLIREIVENAKDAGSKIIEIKIKPFNGCDVLVSDYGRGADATKMSNIPIKIGESQKRLENQQTAGVHAIGLICYLVTCEKLKMVSKAIDAADTYVLEMDKEQEYNTHIANKNEKRETCGMDVYMCGLNQNKARFYKFSKIEMYLAEQFAPDLEVGRIRIVLLEKRNKIEIKPSIKMRGTQLMNEDIKTKCGWINLSLYYSVGHGIKLYRHGSKVVDDIGKLPEFAEITTWQHPNLSGIITCDWIKLSANKLSIERDELWESLEGGICSKEQEIATELSKFEQEAKDKQLQKMSQYLGEKFRLASELMGLDIPSAYRKHKDGDIKGCIIDGVVLEGDGDHGDGGDGGKKKISGVPPIEPKPEGEDDGKQTKHGIPYKVENMLGYNYKTGFDEKLNVIKINGLSKEYIEIRQMNDPNKLQDYLYKCVGQELTLYNANGADRRGILDKYTSLQLIMEKQPAKLK